MLAKPIIILGAIFTVLFAPFIAHAQQRLEQGSLGISPFLIEETVAPGEAKDTETEVFNLTDQPLPIAVSINDFVPSGEHGSVRFLEGGELAHPSFSLASWITITEQPEFLIPARGKTAVRFRVSVPVDAEPGTHYGGLLFSSRDTKANVAGTAVVKKLGAIILVKTGNVNASGRIASFATDKKVYAEPYIQFTSVFENTGNTHAQPKGQIAIRNMFGKLVGEAYVNKDAQYALPQTSREFQSAFQKRWLFGRYTAEMIMWYGNPKLEARAALSFWVVPVRQLALYGGGFVLILAACYIAIRRYNAWLVRKNIHKKS